MPHAAVVYEKDKPMKIEEVAYRRIGEDEVLVKLAACGVCHSDLSILNELYPCPTPVILGHEAAGVVEEVGAKIKGIAKGDHVIGLWKPSCGQCRYCRSGREHLCKMGEDPTGRAADRVKAGETSVTEFLGVGGFSEYTILSGNAVKKIDPAIGLDKAALLGCAVITGFGAAEHAADVQEGDEVAVLGCGGVGLNIIQGARHRGASKIIAVDIDPNKLEMARDFGATDLIDGKGEDVHKAIRKLTTEGLGVDYAFDAVGHVGLIKTAFRAVCRGGGVILVGIPHMKESFALSPFMTVVTEKTIKGSLGGSVGTAENIEHLIQLYKRKALKLDELVTKTYSLAETNEAMDDLREGKNARGVLVYS